MNINNEIEVKTMVIVVFSDQTELWFLKWLARGYRHCFALVEQSEGWVLYDPLSNQSVIRYFTNNSKEKIIQCYESAGYRTIETKLPNQMPQRMAPVLPYTCVEAVKRLLGVHRWFLLTPRQLFKHISEQNINEKEK